MSPLETWLETARSKGMPWRTALSEQLGDAPSGWRKFAKRMIWPRRLRHMSYIPHGVTMEIGENREWTIFKNQTVVTRSVPLLELIPQLVHPVTIVATGPSARHYPWENLRQDQRFIV
ncbi:MAG: hypothetical protein HC767_11280, partial [Akkermansiaceae bacterium]|nr:hypothetical protein [Akkermansiaceae bacterium]